MHPEQRLPYLCYLITTIHHTRIIFEDINATENDIKNLTLKAELLEQRSPEIKDFKLLFLNKSFVNTTCKQ